MMSGAKPEGVAPATTFRVGVLGERKGERECPLSCIKDVMGEALWYGDDRMVSTGDSGEGLASRLKSSLPGSNFAFFG